MVVFFVFPEIILKFATRNFCIFKIMEAKKSTFTHRTPEEIRAWFNRAKTRQQQLEEEGRRMWEEEQRIKAESKKYYELELA